MEDILQGKDYIVEIDATTPTSALRGEAYLAVVCEVTSTFGIVTEGLAISAGCEGGWDRSKPYRSSWRMGGEWQAINFRTADPSSASLELISELAADQREFWVRRKLIDGRTGQDIYREGVAWISNYEETASAEDPFTFTAQFNGVGKPKLISSTLGILHDYKGSPITQDDNYIIVRA